MTKIKRLTRLPVSKDVEQLELSDTTGDVKWHKHFGRDLVTPLTGIAVLTSNASSAWELVRHANSQVPP